MLFIIQNSQNRHTIAIQLKLDEIIRATKGAHNEMMDIEKLTDEDLAKIQKKYGLLAEKTKEDLKNLEENMNGRFEGLDKRIDDFIETRVKYEDHNKLKSRVGL